jgi:hypothetical protein
MGAKVSLVCSILRKFASLRSRYTTVRNPLSAGRARYGALTAS